MKLKGFTFPELLITMAIIAIIAGIAIPYGNTWIKNQELKSSGRQLHNSFMLAKMLAIKFGCRVSVELNPDIAGYKIKYRKYDNINEKYIDILYQHIIFEHGIKIVYNDFDEKDGVRVFSFNSRGIPNKSGEIRLASNRPFIVKFEIRPAGTFQTNFIKTKIE